MSFLQKIKQPLFWKYVVYLTIPFFVFFIIFGFILNNWSLVFEGDFSTAIKDTFQQESWQKFVIPKIIFSVLYGIYMSNKKMK